MYDSLVSSVPGYSTYKFCNNTGKTRRFITNRRPLTQQEKEKKYNVRDYWLNLSYRFRLLELKHDFREADISNHTKNAKSIYKIRGEMESLKYLHEQCKKFFINSCNKLDGNLIIDPPLHHSH